MAKLKLRPINDGYLLAGKFDGSSVNLPTICFSYRPASPQRVQDYRSKIANTGTGEERLGVMVEMILQHVSSWDVTDLKDSAVTISKDSLTHPMMPTLALEHMLNAVQQYIGPAQEADEKNSSTGSVSS